MGNADNHNEADGNLLYDMDGNLVEVKHVNGLIHLYAWNITEDSRGRPYETRADTIELTPIKTIDLARRLLDAATDSKEDRL